MSATRTYSPLPPMIPAGDIFCADPCGPRVPDPCPHTYGVRVGLCAAFATEPCRPTACIPAAPFRHTLCRFRPRQTTTVWRNLPQHPHSGETHTFSAKERDSETGLSYFGSRYYSSDLSIWLSVDPMASKYPSLSPYVYCADNPVKLVDPNGEEFGGPDDPPKRNFLQRVGDAIVRFDKSLGGYSDGTNHGTITKQDVEVGVAVTTAMLSAGAAATAEGALDVVVAVASTANSIDDATINSSGQTASQRVTEKNSTTNKTVNASKTLISAGSALHSGSKVVSIVKNSVKKGAQIIKKETVKVAENTANATSSVRSFVKSIFKKDKKG